MVPFDISDETNDRKKLKIIQVSLHDDILINKLTSKIQEIALTSKNSEVSKETPQFHIVKQGENLYRISLMHNIKVATLQTWNNLEDPGAIFAGMKLWLVPTQLQEK